MVTLCRECHRNAPEAEGFLEYQRKGGSAEWLFQHMTSSQRCSWHLYGWWTHPELRADPAMDLWREKSNAALENTGRTMSAFLAPFPIWESPG